MTNRITIPYAALLYCNRILGTFYRLEKDFLNDVYLLESDDNNGFLKNEEIICDLNGRGLQDNLKELAYKNYKGMEIRDSFNFIRKLFLKHEIKCYQIQESINKESIKSSIELFFGDGLWNNFKKNNFYYIKDSRGEKYFLQIKEEDFLFLLNLSFIPREQQTPDKIKYLKNSPEFFAIYSIIQANLYPMFKRDYSEAFDNSNRRDRLNKHLMEIYGLDKTSSNKIITDLRKMDEKINEVLEPDD